MTQDELKNEVAKAALKYVVPETIIGVGTGSTANFFIDQLATIKDSIRGAVASSIETANRLKSHGIHVFDLNEVSEISVYVFDLNEVSEISVYIDGTDESNHDLNLIKGGGGALTREKIVAATSKQFVCIADDSKLVDILGKFPLPIEVIPMASNYVKREVVKSIGGNPILREEFTTDNGNLILDIHDLNIDSPKALESQLNNIVGVVTNGLFACRSADILLLASQEGVDIIEP